MLRRIPLVTLVALVALSLTVAPAAWASTDAAKVRLPADISFMGKTIEKGRYLVSVADSKDGPTIVLTTKDGAKVLSELAIVQPQKGSVKRARASAQLNKKDEKLLMVAVRAADQRYLAFFELTN